MNRVFNLKLEKLISDRISQYSYLGYHYDGNGNVYRNPSTYNKYCQVLGVLRLRSGIRTKGGISKEEYLKMADLLDEILPNKEQK